MYTKLLVLLAFTFSAHASIVPYKRDLVLENQIKEDYAKLAQMNYQDALIGAQRLQSSIESFVKLSQSRLPLEKLEIALNSTKGIWSFNARIPYSQTEIFRFYNGPIDFEPINDGITSYLESINFEGVEGLLNAWPLDEAYIDYVEGDANAGLINNRSIALTQDLIVQMNERDGEKNISTGFHAIEFLLWGQDRNLQGPGQRPVTDYRSERNADRRQEYLLLLSKTLVKHLSSVEAQWQEGKTNFRSHLEAKDSRDIFTSMFTSMIAMAGDELKSERIENALLLEDQEEEHSCFSDTTVNDIYFNALGVKNVYFADYQGLNAGPQFDGKGLDELISSINPELNDEIKARFNDVFTAINKFYHTNDQGEVVVGSIAIAFDNAIVNDKAKVEAIVNSLHELELSLRQAANELGLTLAI